MDSVQSFYANSLCFIGKLMVATEFKESLQSKITWFRGNFLSFFH